MSEEKDGGHEERSVETVSAFSSDAPSCSDRGPVQLLLLLLPLFVHFYLSSCLYNSVSVSLLFFIVPPFSLLPSLFSPRLLYYVLISFPFLFSPVLSHPSLSSQLLVLSFFLLSSPLLSSLVLS